MANDDSYQNRFSTYIRATYASKIPVAGGDTGADPRPRNVRQALVHVTGTMEEQSLPRLATRKNLVARKPVPIQLSPLPPAASSHQNVDRDH